MTHSAGAEAAVSADAFPASQIKSQSPAVASNPDAVPLFTVLR